MIRDMQPEDVHTLSLIHKESGFDYGFPQLSDPLFIAKKVVEENGKPVQGIALKLQAEVYLWIDHSYSTPEERWCKLQALTEAAKLAAWQRGLDCLVCVVPPEIAETFEKRLTQIGMSRDRAWPKFSFDLTGYIPTQAEESRCVSR